MGRRCCKVFFRQAYDHLKNGDRPPLPRNGTGQLAAALPRHGFTGSAAMLGHSSIRDQKIELYQRVVPTT